MSARPADRLRRAIVLALFLLGAATVAVAVWRAIDEMGPRPGQSAPP